MSSVDRLGEEFGFSPETFNSVCVCVCVWGGLQVQAGVQKKQQVIGQCRLKPAAEAVTLSSRTTLSLATLNPSQLNSVTSKSITNKRQ